ncbi:MAG: hypothetical protein ABFD16_05520 [Thermoguttaceae bacterium]|jgi:hypothetical protein
MRCYPAIVLLVCSVSSVLTSSVVQAALVQAPVFDVQYTSPGIVSDGDIIAIVQSSSSEKRGVLEFATPGILPGATIQSATLELDIRVITMLLDGTSPFLKVYGYAGNGSVDVQDGANLTTQIGTSQDISSVPSLLAISLDTGFLQSIAGSSYLGLVLQQGAADGLQTGFATTEAASLSWMPPRLTIDFANPVPEPSSLASSAVAMGSLIVLLVHNRRRRISGDGASRG